MRLRLWCGIVAVASAIGAVSGWAVGELLARISGDYVVAVAGYVAGGLRAGLLGGTVLAASNLMTAKPLIGAKGISHALMLSVMAGACLVCASAVAGLLLPFLLDMTAEDYNLAHPRRYALFLVLDRSWLAAVLLGAYAGSHWSWRKRCSLDAVCEGEPEQEVDRK